MEPKVWGFRCPSTNFQLLKNIKEELELLMQTEGYDSIGITDTWWDWNVVMDRYDVFKKNQKGRRGCGVVLYVKRDFTNEDLRSRVIAQWKVSV